jgi:hypothetical protein
MKLLPLKRAYLISLHQSAIPNHISSKYSAQTSFHLNPPMGEYKQPMN